ncbi:non-canonical purine NTP pyrophosphatase [Yinghuangia aomiensis]
MLKAAGLDVELVGVTEFPDVADVPETGLTFAANALLKAHAVAKATGLPAIADDSGLCVEALNGMPGIFSARWAGRHGDDRANLDLLLAQLSRHRPPEHRAAHFACAAALALPRRHRTRRRRPPQRLPHHRPRGTNGFGYDPILQVDGDTRTTAELTPDEKNAISHRGKAFRADRARGGGAGGAEVRGSGTGLGPVAGRDRPRGGPGPPERRVTGTAQADGRRPLRASVRQHRRGSSTGCAEGSCPTAVIRRPRGRPVAHPGRDVMGS